MLHILFRAPLKQGNVSARPEACNREAQYEGNDFSPWRVIIPRVGALSDDANACFRACPRGRSWRPALCAA